MIGRALDVGSITVNGAVLDLDPRQVRYPLLKP